MRFINYLNHVIEYSFYALFLLVPLVMTNDTSELFELNKMWLTWGIAVIISSSWIIKMILEKQVKIKRTPFDIPILIFLLSQGISTIFSLDSRISFWGYYSRFNGGFLSLLTYAVLYYAFVSNFSIFQTMRTLRVTIIAGILVALWGLPSHFGHDPTCLLFRGSFDVSCWTDAFHPTVRIFSTLGQPAWMAAYVALLLPLSIAYAIKHAFGKEKNEIQQSQFLQRPQKNSSENRRPIPARFWEIFFIGTALLFYVDLLFANTRGGFLAFWFGNIVFWIVLFLVMQKKKIIERAFLIKYALLFNGIFLIFTFFIGTPESRLNVFTYPFLQAKFSTQPQAKTQPTKTVVPTPTPAPAGLESGITESGDIRKLVWQGALDAWKSNPIIGTGVETFAFAYYANRPAAHNLTSEWDYLYNKAHNEYLNYLATTGIFGLGTHLFIIFAFIFYSGRWIFSSLYRKEENEPKNTELFPLDEKRQIVFLIAFLASFLTILVSNFFGFSVVIINLYFFFLPAFAFMVSNQQQKYSFFTLPRILPKKQVYMTIGPFQWTGITAIIFIAGYFLLSLTWFWYADKAYALGTNLDKVGDYQQAYIKLKEAVDLRGSEPGFKDEFAVNNATLATALLLQKDATTAGSLANAALQYSDEITTNHPNNIVFWKSRVRITYMLGQANPRFYKESLVAIKKAHTLAPTDAKISYNLGVILGQNGQVKEAIQELQNTIRLKPDYRDAYFASAIFYRQLSTYASTDPVKKPEYQQKAIELLHSVLKNLNPNDQQIKDLLKSWGTE